MLSEEGDFRERFRTEQTSVDPLINDPNPLRSPQGVKRVRQIFAGVNLSRFHENNADSKKCREAEGTPIAKKDSHKMECFE